MEFATCLPSALTKQYRFLFMVAYCTGPIFHKTKTMTEFTDFRDADVHNFMGVSDETISRRLLRAIRMA
jgi:hypothetical protein